VTWLTAHSSSETVLTSDTFSASASDLSPARTTRALNTTKVGLPQQPLHVVRLVYSTVCVKKEAQLSLGKADRTAYVLSPASEFQSWRESDLSEVRQFYARYVKGTLSRKLNKC